MIGVDTRKIVLELNYKIGFSQNFITKIIFEFHTLEVLELRDYNIFLQYEFSD